MPVQSETIVRVLMRRRAELIGYAWLVVGDPDLAEDVFQEVSVAAIRKQDAIEDDQHLIGWLYHAVRLQGLKARRQRNSSRLLLDTDVLQLLEDTHAQQEPEDESQQLLALRECINTLQSPARQILEMRYGQNLKPATIAEQTGKKIQTVYKTITRSHNALRQCVEQRLARDKETS